MGVGEKRGTRARLSEQRSDDAGQVRARSFARRRDSRVTHLGRWRAPGSWHVTAPNPAAPAVTANTAKGTITVTPDTTGGVLSVNYHASRLLRGVTVTVSGGAITLGGTIGQPPAARPIPAFAVINDTSPSGAVLAQVIRFTDDAVHGTLALGSVFTDTPGAITRSYQVGGVQFAEPYVVTAKTVPGSPSALDPAPAYSFGYPGLPDGIVNSPAGTLTV